MGWFALAMRRSKAVRAWRLGLLAAVLAAPAAWASEGGGLSIDGYAPSPDPSSVGDRATFVFEAPGLQSSLEATVEGGGAQVTPDALTASAVGQSWTGGRTALTTTWTPLDGASVELDLANQFKRAITQIDPLAPQVPGQLTNTQSQSAKLTAALAPVSTMSLQLGGEVTHAGVQPPAFAAAGLLSAPSDLRNDSARLFTTLTWKPTARFSLEADEALETLGVAAQGPAGASAAYAYPAPRVAGTLTPWTDGALTLSAEETVTAPNAAQFASFIQTADRNDAAFQPDRARRYVASLKQTLGGAVVVSASLTQADLDSVTDLGPVGGGQAPVDIGAGQRRRVDLSLTAPSFLPGLAAGEVQRHR